MQQDYIQSFIEEYTKSVSQRIDYLGEGLDSHLIFFKKRLVEFIQSQGQRLQRLQRLQAKQQKLQVQKQKKRQNHLSGFEQEGQQQNSTNGGITLKQFLSFIQFLNRTFFLLDNKNFSINREKNNIEQVNKNNLSNKSHSTKNVITSFSKTTKTKHKSSNNNQQQKSHSQTSEKSLQSQTENASSQFFLLNKMKEIEESAQSLIKRIQKILKISLGYFYILYDQFSKIIQVTAKNYQFQTNNVKQKKQIALIGEVFNLSSFQNAQKKVFAIKTTMCDFLIKILEKLEFSMTQYIQECKTAYNSYTSSLKSFEQAQHDEQMFLRKIFDIFRIFLEKIQSCQIKKFIQISISIFNINNNIKSKLSLQKNPHANSHFYSNFINKITEVTFLVIGKLNQKLKQINSVILHKEQSKIKSQIQGKQSKKRIGFTSISWLIQPFSHSQTFSTQQIISKQSNNDEQNLNDFHSLINRITQKMLAKIKIKHQNLLHQLIIILQTSLNISTISKIVNLFYFIYNEGINNFSELLYFITQTIRYDLPKVFKSIDQKIRQRIYKLSDSEIVNLKDLNLFMDFEEHSKIFQQFKICCINNKLYYKKSDFLFFLKEFEPFKLKQLIKIQRMKQGDFLKICKTTLKNLKFLIEKYIQYKSGKIVHSDKNHHNRKLSKIQEELIEHQRRKFSQNKDLYEHFLLQGENFTKVCKGKSFTQIGVNVNMTLIQESKQKIKSRKNSLQFQNLIFSVFQKQKQIHRLSQRISQTHNQYNKNNQIIKSSNQTLRKLFEENSELIKVNQWYQEQLRLHQDKQVQMENTIASLIDINKKRDQIKHKFKVFSLTINHTIFPTGNDFGRGSKDSNRARRRSSFNGRFLKDITKISPQGQKFNNDFILPAIPHTLNNQSNLILPPPPPFVSSYSLPPPPPNLQISPPPLPPILNLVPPPLLHSDLRKSFGKKQNLKKKQNQLKTVGWNMVDLTSIRNSFWQEVGQIQFNKEQLIKNFSKKQSNTPIQTFKIQEEKKQKKTILKQDRVKNIEIGLKKVKLTYKTIGSLEVKLYQYDQNFLQIDIIQCLLNILPTLQEKQNYCDINIQQGTQEEWTLADYFLLTISKIESYQQRLKAVRFKLQFGQISQDFFKKLNDLKDFLIDVRTDQFLQNFLQYMLTIGNFLNSNSNKGGAYGFRLQSIPKTYSLIGQDNRTSLFQFILKTLSQKNIECFNNLKTTQKSKMIVSLNILQQDLNSFIKECSAIQQIIIYSRRQGDNSSKYLLPFYINCQQQINTMKKIIKQVKEIYEDILVFYCQKFQCQELINFIKDFRNRAKQFMKKNKVFIINQNLNGSTNFRFTLN